MSRYTEKQIEVLRLLETLVHQRFNKVTLEKQLSEWFNEPITIELGCEDCDYLADWNYMFAISENEEICGDFDIYVLMHKNIDGFGNEFYVTEVGGEFW